YVWSTNPEQDSQTAVNLAPGTYTVTVTDSAGCKISDTVSIYEVPNVFAVPNAFTPNGDGLNDVFIPVQTNIATFEMSIFNRWGQLIYYTADQTKGWDGKYQGRQEEIGAYVYQINATFLDGSAVEKKGNVTLLR
ncbi:MAG: gliding motility-associated C-terminal domain-containing protein, partial [Chitinophagales bacterium]